MTTSDGFWGLFASIAAAFFAVIAGTEHEPWFYGLALFDALGAIRFFIQEAR